MRTALKVIMIIFGFVLILEGLLDIIMPAQRASIISSDVNASSVLFYMTILGATWVAAGIWVVAAGRNPSQHINWVKFVITLPVILSIILIFSIMRGYVGLNQVIVDLVLDGVFALSLLALYPRRRKSDHRLAEADQQ